MKFILTSAVLRTPSALPCAPLADVAVQPFVPASCEIVRETDFPGNYVPNAASNASGGSDRSLPTKRGFDACVLVEDGSSQGFTSPGATREGGLRGGDDRPYQTGLEPGSDAVRPYNVEGGRGRGDGRPECFSGRENGGYAGALSLFLSLSPGIEVFSDAVSLSGTERSAFRNDAVAGGER